MPIFEYQCDACGTAFEALVPTADAKPDREQCGSAKVSKQLSTFSASVAPERGARPWGAPPPNKSTKNTINS